MVALRSILCPSDFSEPSRAALQWAGMLARHTKARLLVVSALEPLLAEAARLRFGCDLVHETEAELRQFVAATWSDDTARAVDTRFAVEVGRADEVILETAAQEASDLIVVGTHGLGGVHKWLLGSTTERLLRRSRIPVFAVPASAKSPLQSAANATPLDTGPVLVGTDFSDGSAGAVAWAVELAQEFATRLCLVHVVEPLAVAPRWQSYVADTDDARVADAAAQLQTLAKQVAGAVNVDLLVERGHPAEAIAAIADKRQASVVLMGLAGRQGVAGPRPGSIAYRVLCLAKVPVLVVPPQAAEELHT